MRCFRLGEDLLVPAGRRLVRLVQFSTLVSVILTTSAFSELAVAESSYTLGGLINGDDCNPAEQRFNGEIMKFGRIAAVSGLMQACLGRKSRENYRKCQGDPFYNAPLGTQLSYVMSVVRSTEKMKAFCSGGSGNASTGIGTYGHGKPETFKWGGWFTSVRRQLPKRLCTRAERRDPDANNCRFADYPWPYSQGAEIAWHEAMHTHGYTHGANEQAPAKEACGYSGDPAWNFQRNTMPYLVGQCVNEVIAESAKLCAIDACDSDRALRLRTRYGVNGECKCVSDPADSVIGLLQYDGRHLVDTAILHDRIAVDGWRFSRSNIVRASGKFNTDYEQLVVTSNWGMGVMGAPGESMGWQAHGDLIPNGTSLDGWRFDSRRTSIKGAGDFDGDGQDELIVTSAWGIGIVRPAPEPGQDRLVMIARNGTAFDGWSYRSTATRIRSIADFNGDGQDDILVTSNWGVAILTLQGTTLTTLLIAPNGTGFGGWAFNSRDNSIEHIGDFDGDGAADILISSPWGVAMLTLKDNVFDTLMIEPNGVSFDGWRYTTTTTRLAGVGDFDGDGADDVVVTSKWGIGILTLVGRELETLLIKRNGTRFGQWRLKNTVVMAVADMDGDDRADILLQDRQVGVALLRLKDRTFEVMDWARNGWLLGSWLVSPKDRVITTGGFNAAEGNRIVVTNAPTRIVGIFR